MQYFGIQQARSTRSALPRLASDAMAAAYRLALLTGQPPEALAGLATAPAPLLNPPARVGVGLRSDLLRRRPTLTLDGPQSRAIGRQAIGLGGHRRCAILGNAMVDDRLLEMPPVICEASEIRIVACSTGGKRACRQP